MYQQPQQQQSGMNRGGVAMSSSTSALRVSSSTLNNTATQQSTFNNSMSNITTTTTTTSSSSNSTNSQSFSHSIVSEAWSGRLTAALIITFVIVQVGFFIASVLLTIVGRPWHGVLHSITHAVIVYIPMAVTVFVYSRIVTVTDTCSDSIAGTLWLLQRPIYAYYVLSHIVSAMTWGYTLDVFPASSVLGSLDYSIVTLFFAGITFAMMSLVNSEHVITFPAIYSRRLLRIQHNIYNITVCVIQQGIAVQIIVQILAGVLFLTSTTSSANLWITDMKMESLWLTGVALFAYGGAWSVVRLNYSIMLTEPIEFPTDGATSNDHMMRALTSTQTYEQAMALLELRRLARFSAARRGAIFSDSRGATFGKIAGVGKNHMNALTYVLQEHAVAVKEQAKAAATTRKKGIRRAFRVWLESGALGPLLASKPERIGRRLFGNHASVLWSSEALSLLLCASYNEDTIGAVQRELQPILCSLLACLLAVENYLKSGRDSMRGGGIQDPTSTTNKIPVAVRTELSTAIGNIVAVFYDYLDQLSFPPEYATRLQVFVDFKES